MKGIILAGGTGTRLSPSTLCISKQLLPIYDKPMIYYPLNTLMEGGIRDLLIISTPTDLPRFRLLLGDGSQLGVNFQYSVQQYPNGIAEALLIAQKFIGNDPVTLILGDNLFFGDSVARRMRSAIAAVKTGAASVFAYPVSDPERYGVVEFDETNNAISIEEKPRFPKSRFAVTGLYIYPCDAVDVVSTIRPSSRGELEISDVNSFYLEKNRLLVATLGRGAAWLDTGTHDSLLEATQFVHAIESRQGLKIGCLEETAWRQGWISEEQVLNRADELIKSPYGQYLKKLVG